MPYKFNPFTGNFDYYESSGGPGVQTPNYSQTFIVGDWSGPVSGYYSLVILAATHGKGLNPVVQTFLLNGSDYEEVETSITVDQLTGNVTLGVVETPDGRFEGKVIIAENN